MKAHPGMQIVPTDMLQRSLKYWQDWQSNHFSRTLEPAIRLIELELKRRVNTLMEIRIESCRP